MPDRPKLIVMLTYNDKTVANAAEIFEQCKSSQADYWGFKEEALPFPEMKALFQEIKRCGKTAVLEVVAYTEEKCLEGAQMAVDCGCDMLMGTVFYDSVNVLCHKHHIQYLPFVGTVSGRPSVLEGSIDEMIAEANEYIAKGASGIDLLAYRYTGDCAVLIRRFIQEVHAPVCIAGSVNSTRCLDEIKRSSPWAFTVGSAFFQNDFGKGFSEQINRVCDYMKEPAYV